MQPMPSPVAIVSQKDYELSSLKKSILRAIELAGFELPQVSEKKVLLKPNLLGAYPPEMGVTTDPAFVETCAYIFKEAGADVSIGDSPNGVHSPDIAWKTSGFSDVCKKVGVPECRFEPSGTVELDGIRIARAVHDADFVISLPKFKTHSLTVLTLAVKNCFGCVNGMMKSRHHRNSADNSKFAELLVRIAERVKPELTIIDGIRAMEGDGPSAGNMMDLGVIVAGRNIHKVDAACCKLLGIDPLIVDTLAAAKGMNIWKENNAMKIVGDPLETMRPKDFVLPRTYTKGTRDWWISKYVLEKIWKGHSAQPVIDEARCQRCHLCVKACPVDAIDINDETKIPKIAVDRCIQCFCCHETCPYKAIDIEQSFVTKLFRKFADFRSRRSKR